MAVWTSTGSAVLKIKAKMWDLLLVMRGNVYHPAFAGSFSLKSVLPALVPELNYADLEIAEGITAGLAWTRFIDPATPVGEKAQLKTSLLKYCGRDTLALAMLLDALWEKSQRE